LRAPLRGEKFSGSDFQIDIQSKGPRVSLAMKLATLSTMAVISATTAITAWAQGAAPASAAIPIVNSVNSATPAEADTAKVQIEAAIEAFQQKNLKFMKRVRAEKDRKKQRAMYRSGRPSPTEAIDLVLELAKKNPTAEGIEHGLSWSLQGANAAQQKEISTLLLTHYKDSAALGKLAQSYVRTRSGGEDGLRKIIQLAGDEKVRQGATYYLAAKLVKKADTKAEGIAMMKKLIASPGIDKNPKLLAQLKGQVRIAEELSIGCTAPDIVGTDQDDKEFKLSDYRGQVVLLDFWGIW
jgi:hypothetical protein